MAKKKAKKKATRKKSSTSTRDTAHTRWISFRLPHGVVEMLDEHVVAQTERTGYRLTRTQALTKIIVDACGQGKEGK